MNKTDRILPRERIYLMNEIAKRDKLIGEQQRENNQGNQGHNQCNP